MNPLSLNGQVALVTGASRGIGLAIARSLLEEGMKVALVASNQGRLDQAAEGLSRHKANFKTFVADLSRPQELGDLVGSVVGHFGKLDVLINNAGVFTRVAASDYKFEDIDNVLNVNLRSLIYLTRHSLPHIEKSGNGAVINLSSVSGRETHPDGGLYCASKHGVMGFTGSLFEDVREKNIKVSVVCPGFVNTEMVESFNLESAKAIQPDDIAYSVLFILKMPLTACPTEIVVRPQRSPL